MPCMQKKTKKVTRLGRPKLNKVTISIRIDAGIWAEVRKAAAAGGNLSAYIEDAVITKLRNSG
jgi:hypothetical protein